MRLTCFRISNNALSGATLPDRIKVLEWGENPSVKGINPRVTDRTLAELPGLQKRTGLDLCALDYEHNTAAGSAEWKRTQEPRKVAGFGRPEVVRGEGLFLAGMMYTPSGVENAREYVDLSPAVYLDPGTGEVLYMHSVALTRAGAIPELSFFSIADPETTGDHAMDYRALLLALLNLERDAADELIQDAIKRFNAAKEAAAAARPASTAAAAAARPASTAAAAGQAPEEQVSRFAAITENIAALSVQLTAMQKVQSDYAAELDRRERQALFDQALREGKLVPLSAEDMAKMPLATLKGMIEKLPVVVPVEKRTPEHIKTFSADPLGADALARVASACGLDPEKVRAVKIAERK